MNRKSSFAAVLVTASLLAACASQNTSLITQQAVELDSIYASNREIMEELTVLRDSIQFYDDIDSGQYYRDRRMLEQEIQRLEYEAEVCRDGGRTLETLTVDEIFRPGGTDITGAGVTRLAVVADSLKAAYLGYNIRVEGHSDSTPLGAALQDVYPSNWELAAARAAAVVRYLVDEQGIPAGQIEIVSFG
ncbi:MAG: OmpA family protein, partial [Rhodothermales bacterium]